MSDHIDDSTTDAEIEATVMRDKIRNRKRLMRLPPRSQDNGHIYTHEETDWCAKVGCRPVCGGAE